MKETASTHRLEALTGVHSLTIAGYSLAKGTNVSISSTPFTVGGYDWAISYYPDGQKGNAGQYVSVFINLQNAGEPAVRTSFRFSFLDHMRSIEKFKRNGSYIFSSSTNTSWGFPKYASNADLDSSGCLKDDRLVVQCVLSVASSRLVDDGEVTGSVVPPSNLHQHIGHLLKSAAGADVTLSVGDKSFRAHRCVLAARSPVFWAQLYGDMKDDKGSIAIEDMDARVFEALLHFMYNDSLPEFMEDADAVEQAYMAQHLLVAADRYGVERLKLMCEDKLSKDMDVSTAANTLAVAEQYSCHHLKASCLKYIAADGEILRAVMKSDGFKHLLQSFPKAAEEILALVADIL